MDEPTDALARLQDAIANMRARRVFFIGGMPKSGTTWLQLLLDAHPEISCRGEGHFYTQLEPLLRRALQRHNGFVGAKNQTVFRDIGGYPQFTARHRDELLAAAIVLLMAEHAGAAPIVGEKTPDNVGAFRQLRDLFPAAKFVMVLRDGRDCAVSGWFHNLRIDTDATQARFPAFSDYAKVYAKSWAKMVEEGLRFVATHPDQAAVISYEAMMRGPEQALGQLLGFLGADTAPERVRACMEAAEFSRLSGGRQRGEEDRSSLFRKGVVGDWRRHFDPEATAAFETVASPMLRRCGYEEPEAADVVLASAAVSII